MTSEVAGAAEAERKKAEASPTRADFEREFGANRVKDEPDGSWTCTLTERQDIRRAHEMQAGVRQIDVERGRVVKSKWDGKKERVVRRDGRVIEVPSETVDAVKHKLRPAGRNGRSAVTYFMGISSATAKYVRGQDGLYFVWNEGWEPVSMWSSGIASPQRDPHGNVWVNSGGGWVLEDEVG